MAVLSGSSRGEIDAPIERCWSLVEDVEAAPSWQRGLERMDVLERDEQGRASVCETLNDVKLLKALVTVRFSYEPPHRLSWTLVRSEDLRSLDGSWELEALGPGRTKATYSLALDPGPVGALARGPMVRMIRPLVVGRRPEELASALSRPA